MASLVTDESTGIKYYVDDDTTEEAAAVSIFKGGPKPFYTPLRADSELAIRERLKNDSVVYFKDENVNNLPDHFTGLRAGDDALYNFTTGDKIPYSEGIYHKDYNGTGNLEYGFSVSELDPENPKPDLVVNFAVDSCEGLYINLADLGVPYRQLSNGRRLYSLYVNTPVTGPAFALVRNLYSRDSDGNFDYLSDSDLVFYIEGPINGKVQFVTENGYDDAGYECVYSICVNYPISALTGILNQYS